MIARTSYQINASGVNAFNAPPLSDSCCEIAQEQTFATTYVKHLERMTIMLLSPIGDDAQ
jgi:hypothetical protein